MKFKSIVVITASCMLASGCAHTKTEEVGDQDAARINRNLVKKTVVYEPGAEKGAIVPDVSSPQLKATLVKEHQENGKLIEEHREWELQGEVTILGIPSQAKAVRN